jgi:serine/threonine protein kinase
MRLFVPERDERSTLHDAPIQVSNARHVRVRLRRTSTAGKVRAHEHLSGRADRLSEERIGGAGVAVRVRRPGDQVGGYTLLAKLGAGGMGETWLAKKKLIDKKFVIKLMLVELSDVPRAQQYAPR